MIKTDDKGTMMEGSILDIMSDTATILVSVVEGLRKSKGGDGELLAEAYISFVKNMVNHKDAFTQNKQMVTEVVQATIEELEQKFRESCKKKGDKKLEDLL